MKNDLRAHFTLPAVLAILILMLLLGSGLWLLVYGTGEQKAIIIPSVSPAVVPASPEPTPNVI